MTPISCSDIPGPGGTDMLRSVGLIRRNPPLFLDKCRQRFGDVVSFPIPRSCVVFVSDPSVVRDVLQHQHAAYSKDTVQYRALAAVTGEGLLASDGAVWRRMRRLEQPAFRTELIDALIPAVVSQTDRLLERWRRLSATTVIDVELEMSRLAMDVVGVALCGVDVDDLGSSLVASLAMALDVTVAQSQQPKFLRGRLAPSANGRFREALSTVDRCVGRIICQRRKKPGGPDVLWLLLEALDEGRVTPTEVRNELVTLIVAGQETVATALTWSWLLLAKAPDAVGQISTEAAVVEQRWDGHAIEGLRYTRAVVDETLRLFPPAWVVSRKSRQAQTIGDYDLPAGSTVIVSPYVLHRDSRYWSEPDRFWPERFINESNGSRAPSTYLPFGVGPRMCIGRDLALMEVCVVLARIASRAKVSPTMAAWPRATYGTTMRPRGGLPATVQCV